MTENYKFVRLGDLCDSISGLWTGKKPPFQSATVIRNTNFTKDCRLDLTNVAILDVETRQLQTRRLIPGDLIVEKSGGGPNQAVGRVVYFNESFGTYSLSNFTSALRIKNPNEVLPKYIQHFLYYQYISGVMETMQSNSTGIRNLNIHQFLDIEVPLPSKKKQDEIVNKLDSIIAEIEKIRLNIFEQVNANLLLLSQTIRKLLNNPNIDYRDVTIDQISENLDTKRIPITRGDRISGSYPYYGASGIIDYVEDYIFEGDALLISEDGANLLARSTPIAFSVSGKYWVNNHAHILKFVDQELQKYVENLLENIELDPFITGAAQPKLTQRALNTIPIRIPVQESDVKEVVEVISSLKVMSSLLSENLQLRLKLTHELKTALLGLCFTQEGAVA